MKHRRRGNPFEGRRLRLLAAGTTLTLLAGSAAATAEGAAGPGAGLPADGGARTTDVRLNLEFRPEVSAAEMVTVRVRGVPSGAPVSLISVGSLGATTTAGTAGADGAAITLPATTTRWAGAITLIARSGDATATGTLRVVPGPVTGPVPAVVGPRSIVADGTDMSMVVSTPTDRFGNAAADGTRVDVVRRLPTGAQQRTRLRMAGLLTYALLPSGTTAATGQVRVGVGSIAGPAVSLDEVAAPPVRFTVRLIGPVPPADGHSLVAVRTSQLRDRFGNVQPDGTEVRLIWNNPTGRGEAVGYTISGVAQFSVEVPGSAGTTVFRAVCRGTWTARQLAVWFRAVRPVIALTANRGMGGVAVVIGPVTGSLGALVADGTPVTVSITDQRGRSSVGNGQLVNGTLRVVLPVDRLTGPLRARATVLGASRWVDVK